MVLRGPSGARPARPASRSRGMLSPAAHPAGWLVSPTALLQNHGPSEARGSHPTNTTSPQARPRPPPALPLFRSAFPRALGRLCPPHGAGGLVLCLCWEGGMRGPPVRPPICPPVRPACLSACPSRLSACLSVPPSVRLSIPPVHPACPVIDTSRHPLIGPEQQAAPGVSVTTRGAAFPGARLEVRALWAR